MTSITQQFRTLHNEWFHKEQKQKKPWPFLEELRLAGGLLPVDLAFASLYTPSSEAIAALLCYLLVAARQGHLYVEFHEDLLPSPSSLWPSLPQELLERWSSLWAEGVQTLPSSLLSHPDPLALSPLPTSAICSYQHRYYLQKNWVYETRFAYHLRRLEGPLHPVACNESELSEGLQPEQKLAILHACQNNITFISGGPGTGKTFTAGHLASLLIQKQPHLCHAALLAPTGKAAVRLQASLLERLSPLPQTLSITSATLHKVLGISPYRKEPKFHALSPLQYDLLIIDEASMIDVRLMADLLAAIKDGARVIFLGDKDQLPPVEAGALFAEIAYKLPAKTVSLKRSLRTDSDELGALALAVRKGEEDKVLKLLNAPSSSAISFSPLDTPHLIAKIAQQFPPSAHIGWDKKTPPEELLAAQNFCLLSPVRQGPFGVHAINQKLSDYFSREQKPSHWPVTPILIVQNDATLGLYNGDVGLLVTPHKEDEPPFAWFASLDGGARKLIASRLPNYEPAYCLSVHKSQGSEFEGVALLLPPGSAVFGRKMLYTAITRAKKKLDIYSDADVLKEVLKVEGNRLSGSTLRLLAT